MPSVDEPVLVPAPDLPAGRRSALVIATSRYDDSRLNQLRAPVRDAEDLAAVLADPDIGGFSVATVIDQTEARIRREIAAFLHERTADETVLIYLSCHGIQDRRGRLLFAATDTETQFPHASAVRATELLDELDECKAHQQILILDCCFSGSFSDSKGGRKGELDLERQLRGHSRGREVLTASRGFEYSYEGEPLDGVITGSVFTTGLVQGLRTGAADTSKDGHVTVEEAYDYAFAYVQKDGSPQTPQRWLFSGEGGKIVLARSAAGRAVVPARLPEHLLSALESGSPHVRIGAVNGIAEWLADPDPARVLAARQALAEIADNDIRRVAEVATDHLERIGPPAKAAPVAGKPRAFAPRLARRAPDSFVPQTGEVFSAATGGTALAFSPDGALLAVSGGLGQEVRIFDVPTRSQQRLLEGNDTWAYSLAFSPDGVLLAAGGSDGTVSVRESSTDRQVLSLRGNGSRANNVAFSPDGILLAAHHEHDTVLMWEAATGQQVHVLKGQGSLNAGLAFSPDGVLFATGAPSATGRVLVREVATGKQVQLLQCHDGWAFNVAFSPDGALLAAGGGKGTIQVWNLRTGEQVHRLEGHSGYVSHVAVSPDGQLLVSGGSDHVLRVWNLAAGAQVGVLKGHSAPIRGLAFSPAEPLLASVSEDSVRLWR